MSEPTEPCTESNAGKHFFICTTVEMWFPTGYGKSICFQLIPFLLDFKLNRTTVPQVERSVVLVISPLVSLMVDQVSGLQRRGVPAAILSGTLVSLDFLGLSIYSHLAFGYIDI